MGEDDIGDFFGVAGHELDDVWGKTGFQEDGVENVVGGDRGGRRFPDDHVTHQRGRTWKVAGDGGEIEWGDCIDKALQGAIFNATVVLSDGASTMIGSETNVLPYSRGVVYGLLCV